MAGSRDSKEVTIGAGPIRYREIGAGAPVVFVHGLLVNGELWRKVVPPLAAHYRCIVPDWPLGSHSLSMRAEADLSPPGLARIIVDFLAALDLDDVTLVGNDTGGALCQLVVTSQPDRIGRLVLTSCDAYDNFLPLAFRPLQLGARVPGFTRLVAASLRLRWLQRSPLAFGWLAKRAIEPDVMDAYTGPLRRSATVRRDVTKVLRGISSTHTLAAAERFRSFAAPVLIAWAAEDRFFPVEHGRRLAAAFPSGRLELVEDSYTFIPEDQPARLAHLMSEFLAATTPAVTSIASR